MDKVLSKIANVLETIFGYGIMLSLFLGGMSFLGYFVALIAGGETGEMISTFIYKNIYPVLVYGTSSLVLLGIVKMYLKGETALSAKSKKKN